MKFNRTYKIDELSLEIKAGKKFLVAGEENQLAALPKGNWIGGTIPYFMSHSGGVIEREKVFATELPVFCKHSTIKFYDESSIDNVYTDIPENGFSIIIIPANSKTHLQFAVGAPEFNGFATKPLVGWISGTHLNDLGNSSAKVFSGFSQEKSDLKAIVMHVELEKEFGCEIGIVNIFLQGSGDVIEFPTKGFEIEDAIVNGTSVNFAEYVSSKKMDEKLPLVANYAGAMINVSFQSVDKVNGRVKFYAPVFPGIKYRQAEIISDYEGTFTKNIPSNSEQILFSCNCILNFLYSELEGKKTGGIVGPITFGEVAYQLLNQTLVYLKVIKL